MNDWEHLAFPPAARAILLDTRAAGFVNASDQLTGALLRSLAAAKPGGRLLELGTGTGYGTAWLLDGMDRAARLVTVEVNSASVAIARRHLGHDPRVEFIEDDAARLFTDSSRRWDLIYADCPFGKHHDVETVLDALAPGGIWVADDMLPHTYTPEREPMQRALPEVLSRRPDLHVTKLSWSTGILLATKRA
jgi:predicted O-methyltransferase YrrM